MERVSSVRTLLQAGALVTDLCWKLAPKCHSEEIRDLLCKSEHDEKHAKCWKVYSERAAFLLSPENIHDTKKLTVASTTTAQTHSTAPEDRIGRANVANQQDDQVYRSGGVQRSDREAMRQAR